MKSSNSTTTIYWAPAFPRNPTKINNNWGILYSDPKSLYDEMRQNMVKDEDQSSNMFYCPAFKNLTSNTYVIRNPMKADFKIIDRLNIINNTSNFISSTIVHNPSIENCILFTYGMSLVFFAEDDDINMTLTSPFFDTPNHLKYGNICPGKFSISNWFRVVHAEFNLKPNVNELVIEEDEPLMYVNFDTDKKINLIRFDITHQLQEYLSTCDTSSQWESWVPLAKRYKRFKQSRMKFSVLREIKKNLVI